MVTENIIEKIRHLLVMAEHPNSNPHEAALAMERAQALLLTHNLDRATITNGETSTPSGIGKIDRTEANGYIWKRYLVNGLAKSMMCHVVVSPSCNQWHLFGSYENVRTVLEMYDWLILQMIPMAVKGFREYKDQGGFESSVKWHKGFYFGAIETIGNRLRKPYQDFAQGTGHALVVYNDKALSEAVHRVYPRLSHGRGTTAGGSDGRTAGRIAGNKVSFAQARQVSGRLVLNAG